MKKLRIRLPFRRKPSEPLVLEPLETELPVVPEVIVPKPGRVIRAGKHKVYDPLNRRSGGRMVKAMPRNLRQIKVAQEELEDATEE